MHMHMSHLFSKDSQALPQRVKSSHWTCVVISIERKWRTQSNIQKLCKYGKKLDHSLKCIQFLSAGKKKKKEDVLHPRRLAITSPVVCKPTQIQEERHRLCPPVEYFLAVDKFNLQNTCNIYSKLLLLYTPCILTMLFH